MVADARPDEEISVIFKVKDTAQLQRNFTGTKKQRRANFIKALRSNGKAARQRLGRFIQPNGPASFRELWIINGIAATVRSSRVEVLAAHPDVEFIALNTTLSAPILPQTAFSSPPEWNLEAIHAEYFWGRGFDGSGIVIASMDTGVDVAHQDLAATYRGGANSWFDPHDQHATPADTDPLGHGTAVMGVMVGGDLGGTAIGVAPGAQWIAVKLFDDAGFTTTADILESFAWLLDPDGDPDTDDAPDLVNGSWGYETIPNKCYGGTPPLELIRLGVQNLKNAGIGVVFSAGNVGPDEATSLSPANYPESIAVGMIDDSLAIDPLSSRGPSACDGAIFPSLVAPGVAVRTTDRINSYQYVTGTSIAAPHVTGAMALLLSADQQLGVAELESLLLTTASDLGPAGPENVYGYGLVNLYTAYKNLFGTDFDWNLFLPAIIGGPR